MGEGPTNKRFGEDWARLMKDLLFDSKGCLKFKTDLWNDIRSIIVSTLVDQVRISFHFTLYWVSDIPLFRRSATFTSLASSALVTPLISL
jgi:hypothetical protein